MRMKRCIFHLPGEIMLDIFSRLPFQSLSQCRFVCKDWYNFIKDPIFVNLHHSRTHQEDPGFLILCHGKKLYLVDHEYPRTSLKALNSYFHLPPYKIKIVGSSNGLMCLCLLPSQKSFYICNPITREILKLPIAPGHYEKIIVCGPTPSGFAFDATTHTYKVVHTWCFVDKFKGNKLVRTGVQIYTVGSGKWRRVEDIPICFCYTPKTSQVFLNGALHWEIYYKGNSEFDNCIGAIDIGAGKFIAFKKPPINYGIKTRNLSSLRECLCVIDETVDSQIVVWIMKCYGIEQSWTKEYIFGRNRLGPLLRAPFQTLRTMKNGTVLLHDGEVQGYFDLEKKEFLLILIDGGIPWRAEVDLVIHHGSLISPKSIDGTPAKDQNTYSARPQRLSIPPICVDGCWIETRQ